MRIITDEMLQQARDPESGMSRIERGKIFYDRELEDRAMNARYTGGLNVKEIIDHLVAAGGTPRFYRDPLGKQYYQMLLRRQQG